MMYTNIFLLLPVLGLIIWFWVLVLKLLVRGNKALKIYIDQSNK